MVDERALSVDNMTTYCVDKTGTVLGGSVDKMTT